ncbi:MAG: hypothetical protein JSS02_32915 [Planctomycetes bacterium]|nr:hypothetical protein [Planctomycetota bacterium]
MLASFECPTPDLSDSGGFAFATGVKEPDETQQLTAHLRFVRPKVQYSFASIDRESYDRAQPESQPARLPPVAVLRLTNLQITGFQSCQTMPTITT